MFMRMSLETTAAAPAMAVVADHPTAAMQAHAMGCGTDVEPDPYARLWAERRTAAAKAPQAVRVAALR